MCYAVVLFFTYKRRAQRDDEYYNYEQACSENNFTVQEESSGLGSNLGIRCSSWGQTVRATAMPIYGLE
jgi:hypothetical protein